MAMMSYSWLFRWNPAGASVSVTLYVYVAQLNFEDRCLPLPRAALTCVVHRVPHLEAADVAELAVGIAFEDELSREGRAGHMKGPEPCIKTGSEAPRGSYQPRFDLPPQVFELL